jgi:DsbC/DsbD-like thiol-disulfide interchange protein
MIGQLVIAALLLSAAQAQTGAKAPLDANRPAEAVAVVEPATVAPGGEATLKITLNILEGGHANSNVPADPNLVPTRFTAKATTGITWGNPRYPEPQTVREWYAQDPLSVYSSGSVISVPFTVEKTAREGAIDLAGVILTQICDHEKCYPPYRVKVAARVMVKKE